MTTKRDCSAKTPDMYGVPNVHPCARSATVEHEGKHYCWQHDPERVAGDKEKRLADWQAESAREVARYANLVRNAKLGALVTGETAVLLGRLADYARQAAHAAKGYPDDVDCAYNDEEITRALAARIREALGLEVNDEG